MVVYLALPPAAGRPPLLALAPPRDGPAAHLFGLPVPLHLLMVESRVLIGHCLEASQLECSRPPLWQQQHTTLQGTPTVSEPSAVELPASSAERISMPGKFIVGRKHSQKKHINHNVLVHI